MIRIGLPSAERGDVAVTYSPLLECVLSLHVLVDPRHHALQHPWVRRMRALDPSLRRRIEDFAFLYRFTLPDLVVPGVRPSGETFAHELERLVGHPGELLLEGFGRTLFDHGGCYGAHRLDEPRARRVMLSRAGTHGPAGLRLATELLEDPVAFALAFCTLLHDYWESSFRTEWLRIESLLASSVAESRHLLELAGMPALLGRLPRHARFDLRRNELHIDLPHEHTVAISAESPLVLAPSVFVWPHLRVACDPPWSTALVYAAPALVRDASARIPPADMLLVLRAVADDTRLRVLKLIAERPRTTQELAPLVGLSVTGVSKCLRRLAEAGLVSPRRDGYYVVYSIVRERLEAVSSALATFLEQ